MPQGPRSPSCQTYYDFCVWRHAARGYRQAVQIWGEASLLAAWRARQSCKHKEGASLTHFTLEASRMNIVLASTTPVDSRLLSLALFRVGLVPLRLGLAPFRAGLVGLRVGLARFRAGLVAIRVGLANPLCLGLRLGLRRSRSRCNCLPPQRRHTATCTH